MEDQKLITEALDGSKTALESLIKKYQDWVFNVAINFTGDPNEAADLSQEVLIKIITKLDTFQQKSNFKTWVFRIAKNHFLNMKRSKYEQNTLSFDQFGDGLDALPDAPVPSHRYEVEEKLLIKEAKLSCMKGMLLCLDREQRMIYIIGELFEFSDTIGSQIMEISKANFRVKLYRAKQQLYGFMDNKCGLINKRNPCRCSRKTASFIKMGYVDPIKLYFQRNVLSSIEQTIEKKVDVYQNEITVSYQQLYQQHPFVKSDDDLLPIQELLTSDTLKNVFNFD